MPVRRPATAVFATRIRRMDDARDAAIGTPITTGTGTTGGAGCGDETD